MPEIAQQTRKPGLSAFIPVGIFALVILFLGIGLTKDPHKLPSTMIDRPMPDFQLDAIAPGIPVLTNQDLKQNISLVNIFGSWCASCLTEHPTLMRLQRENVIDIYGVDWRDTPEKGRAWLEQHGNPYTKVGVDADSKLAIDLGVTGAPETFVVDADGRIRYKHIGPITEDVWRDVFVPLLSNLEAEE